MPTAADPALRKRSASAVGRMAILTAQKAEANKKEQDQDGAAQKTVSSVRKAEGGFGGAVATSGVGSTIGGWQRNLRNVVNVIRSGLTTCGDGGGEQHITAFSAVLLSH